MWNEWCEIWEIRADFGSQPIGLLYQYCQIATVSQTYDLKIALLLDLQEFLYSDNSDNSDNMKLILGNLHTLMDSFKQYLKIRFSMSLERILVGKLGVSLLINSLNDQGARTEPYLCYNSTQSLSFIS